MERNLHFWLSESNQFWTLFAGAADGNKHLLVNYISRRIWIRRISFKKLKGFNQLKHYILFQIIQNLFGMSGSSKFVCFNDNFDLIKH